MTDTLNHMITASAERLIDLSGDIESQCRHLGYFRDAALTQAQEADCNHIAEFWLSEARVYDFEITSARAVLAFRGRAIQHGDKTDG